MSILLVTAPIHPSPSPASAGHTDPAIIAFLLGCLFVPPMFVFFLLGLGHLIDWFQVRGWRPESQRRKLK